jgi:hypothetical protein
MPMITKIAPDTFVLVFAHEFAYDLHRNELGIAQFGHKASAS